MSNEDVTDMIMTSKSAAVLRLIVHMCILLRT